MKCPECEVELEPCDIVVKEITDHSITVSHWLKDDEPDCDTWWSYNK